MTPYDRIAERAQAFTLLGVHAAANKSEIRRAFKKLAFEKHPDRNPGAAKEFARISEAYNYLCSNAKALGIPDGPAAKPAVKPTARRATVSRPTVKSEEIQFDQSTIQECQEMLQHCGATGASHVATSVTRYGRHLSYYVEHALPDGLNEVAIPTGLLVDSRHVIPKVVAFDSSQAQNGCLEVDLDQFADEFPGARTIKIRFVGN